MKHIQMCTVISTRFDWTKDIYDLADNKQIEIWLNSNPVFLLFLNNFQLLGFPIFRPWAGMSIDFEVAGENLKVAGKLMRTAVCPRHPLQPGVAQGPQKLWHKWCKILHSRPLLALNFIIETSFFCTIFLIFSAIVQDKRSFFYYFWLYCGSDSGTSICWLQRCIKILFIQCNLTWKTEQLTNYKCSLIQYGDENDSEVLVQNFIASLCILCFLKKPSSEPCLLFFCSVPP
jgi:hypothetical protein